MRYFEYVYLILAAMTCVFLFMESENLAENSKMPLWIVTFLFVSMYLFKRSKRIKAEKKYAEDLTLSNQDITDNAEY